MLALLCVFDAIALSLGAWVVWRSRWRGPLHEFVSWLAGGMLSGTAAMALMAAHGGFGQIRGLAHAGFCVLLPLVVVRGVRVWRHCRCSRRCCC